jgi:hypothetical protein
MNMTTARRLVLQTSALMTAAFAAGAAQPQASKPSFSITISAPETVVKAGGSVKVSLAIRNESRERILLLRSPALGDAEIYTDLDVRDEKGRPVAEGRYYGVLKGRLDPHKSTAPGFIPPIAVGGSHVRQWVAPGETWKDEITVTNLVDMTRPGRYTISLSHIDPADNEIVKSNTITVTITE